MGLAAWNPGYRHPAAVLEMGMVFERDIVGAEFKNWPHEPGGCSFWF